MEEAKPVLAVNTLAFHGYEFARILEQIKFIGFSHVEPALISSYYTEMDDTYFSTERAKRLAALIGGQALAVTAMSAHMDLGTAGGVDSFRRRMDFALQLGARYIHTNSTSRGRASMFMRNLEGLLPHAQSGGLVITLENPGDGEDNIIGTGRQGGAFIRKIGSPNVRLNYDFSNVYSYSKGRTRPEEDFKEALPFAAHLHLKEMRPDGKSWRFVAIGDGITDYRSIFSYLAKRKIDRPMSIELPLRFYRGSDFRIRYDPAGKPPSLSEIRRILEKSKNWVLENLFQPQGKCVSHDRPGC
jgi:sugar phosphate isomerase/epimerase